MSLYNIAFQERKIGTYKKWDSLANMQILMELEKQLDIRFSIDELSDLNFTKKILNKLKIK